MKVYTAVKFKNNFRLKLKETKNPQLSLRTKKEVSEGISGRVLRAVLRLIQLNLKFKITLKLQKNMK